MVHNKKPDRNATLVAMAAKTDEAGSPLYTYEEVADTFQISKQRVQAILKAEGVELRHPAKSYPKRLSVAEGA